MLHTQSNHPGAPPTSTIPLTYDISFFSLLTWTPPGMSPNVHVQMQWPPVGIEAVGWDKRALVMSAVLAGSYFSANIAMVAKDPKVRTQPV